MKSFTIPASRTRRLGLFLLLTMILAACQPDFGPPKVEDVALDSDGIVVPTGTAYGDLFPVDENTDGLPPSLTETGTTSEHCIANNHCIRLVDERTIEETTDGWETSEVVWQISPTASWLNHEYGGAYPAEVGLFDLVEAQDGTVVVAGGQLGVITRSVDGVWSPSVSELRTLPLGRAGLLLTQAVAILVAIWVGYGRATHGSGPAKAAITLLLPSFVLSTAILHGSGGLGLWILAILSVPLAAVGVSVLIGALIRTMRSPNFAPVMALPLLGLLGSHVAAWSASYVLWSRDVIGWNLALFLTASLLAGIAFAGTRISQLLPERPWTEDDVFVIDKSFTSGRVIGWSIVAVIASLALGIGTIFTGQISSLLAVLPLIGISIMVTKLPYLASDLPHHTTGALVERVTAS